MRKSASLSRSVKIIIGFYAAVALVLLSGFYLPGGFTESTPVFVVWHGNLVFGVLMLLTVGPLLLLISFLFSPPLHEQVYVLFPHENLAPILAGLLYLLVAYGLWKRRGSAWIAAAFFALSSLVTDLVFAISIFPQPFGLIYWTGAILDFLVLQRLAKREVRAFYGDPLKKLKNVIFKSTRRT